MNCPPVVAVLIRLFVVGCLFAAALPAYTASSEQSPLAPPDRSTPGATLRSFMEQMDVVHASHTGAVDDGTASRAFRQAVGCLDLSQVAPSLHFDVGGYSVLLLKEVLDRLALPAFDEIPDGGEDLEHWTIPGTELVIARVKEGELAGQYLFSARTVERVQEFYDRIKGHPYLPHASPGMLDFYLDNPGGMIPLNWRGALPGWAAARVLDRPLWKWGALILYLVVSVAIVRGVHAGGQLWDRRFGGRYPFLRLGTLSLAITLVVLAWGLDLYVDEVIGLRGNIEVIFKRGSLVLTFAFASFFIFAVFEVMASAAVASSRIAASSANAHLTKLLVRICGIGVVVFVVVEASAYLGWAVAPVVAGLGVGGLAVALAARPTIENVIGGLTLFADKPFHVGDLCKLGEDIGHIEEIGLRSTRIRTRERSLVSIPNADLAVMKIDNLGQRDQRLFRTTLGLRYETTPDQLRWVLAKTREMLLAHPMTSSEKMRTRFTNYGSYSLDIQIFVYLHCQSEDSFLAITEDLLLRIMDIVKESGTSFAFPSQVNYISQDGGIDAAQCEKSEQEVSQWRQRGKLPFPEFQEEHEDALRDTLDYPPRGSPDFTPRA